jgi:hypothetical protein
VTGRVDWILAAAGRAAACRGVDAGGARGQAASIGAVFRYLVLRAATRSAGVVGADEAGMISTSRQLCAAVCTHAQVARGATVFVAKVDVDPIAVRSATRTARTRCGAPGVLAARCEEKAER